MTYRIISQTDAIVLDQEVEGLKIELYGRDIAEQEENFQVMTIVVENTGGTTISPHHFDQTVEWGILFNNASVLEVTQFASNSDYIRTNLNPRIETQNGIGADRLTSRKVLFDKIILEENERFVLDVFLWHLKSHTPYISPLGKIAGIEDINISTEPVADGDAGFFERTFGGNIVTQGVRAIAYSALLIYHMILVFAVGFVIVTLLTDWVRARRRRRRERQARQALTKLGRARDRIRSSLVSLFADHGAAGLASLRAYVEAPGLITWFTPSGRWVVDRSNELSRRTSKRDDDAWSALLGMDVLEDDGDGNITIDPAVLGAILDLLDMLGLSDESDP
ncbi:MAG: hypothetical protein OXF79_25395 [Chloroflexi bacterium]|nr:hypothetical protein [Chloroflexota bacterium]